MGSMQTLGSSASRPYVRSFGHGSKLPRLLEGAFPRMRPHARTHHRWNNLSWIVGSTGKSLGSCNPELLSMYIAECFRLGTQRL